MSSCLQAWLQDDHFKFRLCLKHRLVRGDFPAGVAITNHPYSNRERKEQRPQQVKMGHWTTPGKLWSPAGGQENKQERERKLGQNTLTNEKPQQDTIFSCSSSQRKSREQTSLLANTEEVWAMEPSCLPIPLQVLAHRDAGSCNTQESDCRSTKICKAQGGFIYSFGEAQTPIDCSKISGRFMWNIKTTDKTV